VPTFPVSPASPRSPDSTSAVTGALEELYGALEEL